MNLVIDIGNSRVKAGVFAGKKLVWSAAYKEFSIKTLAKLGTSSKGISIKNVIVCTVTEYPAGLIAFLKKHYNLLILTGKTPLPFQNKYKSPKTLGKDRLAAIAGAYQLFQGNNVLVINAGTCITCDFISSKGIYQGGSIAPGMEMRFKALHTFTARLPLVKPENTFRELAGRTTTGSILAGVQRGISEEIDGIIRAYSDIYPGLKIILTGGWHKWLKKQLKGKIKSEPFLVLKGLNVILKFCIAQNESGIRNE